MFELFTGILFLFAIVAFPIVHRYFITRPLFFKAESQRVFWRELAADYNLDFIPGHYQFFGKCTESFVIGNYQNHPFKLDTFQRAEQNDKVFTYTRIVVTINKAKDEQLKLPDNEHISEAKLTSKELIRRLTTEKSTSLKGPIYTEANGSQLYYEQLGIESDVDYLKSLFDILSNKADIHAEMVTIGGEAALVLQDIAQMTDSELRDTVIELLKGIAKKTTQELGHKAHRLVCPRCLARFGAFKLRLSWLETTSYYGCRLCHQSQEFLEVQVFAVLDQTMTTEQIKQNRTLQVNWFARRELFDFDGVAIVQATDEEVERFAIQVGNDMDRTRQARYKQIRCAVASECRLSENTLRILQRTFGELIIK
jgi:RNase P subunit RPR2